MSADLPYRQLLDAAAAEGRVLHRNDVYGSGPPNAVANPEVLSLITAHCRPPVLDVGCGIGVYVAALQDRGVDAVGMEVNAEYVETASSLGRDVRLYDGQTIPFASKSFNTAIAIEVLEHVPNWEHLFREMLRVARSTVLISVPNIEVIPAMSKHLVVPWHMLEATHVNFFTPEIMSSSLRRLGGIDVRIQTYGAFQVNGELFHNHVFAIVSMPGVRDK